MRFVERNGYLERVWKVTYSTHGFKYFILVEGTEPEMQAYMNSEMGFVGGYHALTDREVECTNSLHIPIYLAPKDPYQ